MKTLVEAAEFIPIVLAIIAIIVTAWSYKNVRRRTDVIVKLVTMFTCMLLVVAQTSWWESAIVQGDLVGTWFANKVWLVFNISTMFIFIINSLPRHSK